MNQQDYDDGMADGLAGRDPQVKRMALGSHRLNDYERGYIDSGKVTTEQARTTPE